MSYYKTLSSTSYPEMLHHLKQEYGPNSPRIAEHLNSLGLRHLYGGGDGPSALRCHREALSILDRNRCEALLFDREEESRAYATDMAITFGDIGNVLREMNDFIGSAAAYKECLDLFLEGLVEGGGSLKRRLVESEEAMERRGTSIVIGNDDGEDACYEELLQSVNQDAIGRTLGRHPGYRSAIRGISNLFREMQYVKFIAER